MPVHRFDEVWKGIQEFHVGWEDDRFIWHMAKASTQELIESTDKLPIELVNDWYDSEINLLLPGWIKSVSQCLEQGLVLLIDYGFPQHEYYHADRSMGTLMCHYRHRFHISSNFSGTTGYYLSCGFYCSSRCSSH